MHTLEFKPKPINLTGKYRISNNQTIVFLPSGSLEGDTKAQEIAILACVETLRVESKELLPVRVADIASSCGYTHKEIKIKTLKSRWGSCSQAGVINLNLYLIQLPWQLIDYVILHELVHTKEMSHGKNFWLELSKHLSDPKKLRKELKQYRPNLTPKQII
jgi:predicted metal-dependent hydrolase